MKEKRGINFYIRCLGKVIGLLHIIVGIGFLAFAGFAYLIEKTSPSPDHFGMVFVISCGPIGLIILAVGIAIWKSIRLC
jgi:hypothetical protein